MVQMLFPLSSRDLSAEDHCLLEPCWDLLAANFRTKLLLYFYSVVGVVTIHMGFGFNAGTVSALPIPALCCRALIPDLTSDIISSMSF